MTYTHELIILAQGIFLLGLVGFIESRDFLNLLIYTELMILAINFVLLTSGLLTGAAGVQAFVICILAVTAAETAIGLGLLILLYRATGNVAFSDQSTLKG